MPESFRERVDTASAIKGILDCYPFGNGILRELLQNSDDAGATSQIFILDSRTHGVRSLIDPVLAGTQGPSLLAVNDTIFQDRDWVALRTIHGSNKTSDETKIGKYGLGFRSCYYVTDTPHILSGTKLVIFDPHEELSPPHDGGVTIDLVNEGAKYADQLAAFKPIVPNHSTFYNGTVVRLPLRTSIQASRSKIKPKQLLPSGVRQLFREFVEKELSVAMLFLKNIAFVELREITSTGREMLVGKVEIENHSMIKDQRKFARGSAARLETFQCRVITRTSATLSSTCTWRIHHSVRDAKETSSIMSKRLGYDVGESLTTDKLFSHIALAFPLDGSSFKGRLFTLLPLPIFTDFPLHLHSILALTPDRQSLRNKEETGMGLRDRERLLVEWNHAIFDTFSPVAWAKMIRVLIETDNLQDIWTAWPPALSPDHAKGLYWRDLPRNLLAEVLEADLAIFPVYPNTGHSAYVSLTAALVASPNADISVLHALVRAGISIVQPPAHLFRLLRDGEYTPISPRSVYAGLLKYIDQLISLSSEDKDTILNYLILTSLPTNFSYVIGLPLLPLVNGTRTALSKPGLLSTTCVLASAREVDLYGHYEEQMIPLSALSPELQQIFSTPRASQAVNVVLLGKNHVTRYLHSLFGRFDRAVNEVDGVDAIAQVAWLARFWDWMDSWGEAVGLLPYLQQFHLLPTAAGTLRKVQSRILLPTGVDPKAMGALGKLGVQFLHSSVAIPTSGFLATREIGKRADDIPFILELIKTSLISNIDRFAAVQVQKHFIHSLQKRATVPVLSSQHREKYLALPIFPTCIPIQQPKDTFIASVVGPAVGKLVYIQVDNCPLPIIPSTTYIDVSKATRILAGLIDPSAVKNAFNELKILQTAIQHLESQPTGLLDALTSRIMSRMLDLPSQSLDKLRYTSFVPIDQHKRTAPINVIDPESDLSSLYDGEHGKLPIGQFRRGRYLLVMQNHRFFQRSLTTDIVSERINYISTHKIDPTSLQKARHLLRLLDRSWSMEFPGTLNSRVAWLPTQGRELRCADDCRDMQENTYFFDQVLSVVDAKISSLGLRQALGWSQGLTFEVLQSQFCATLDKEGLGNREQRLIALIKYMATRVAGGNIVATQVETLRAIVGNRSWIPIAPGRFASTRHAMLSADAKVGEPFKKVPRSLSDGVVGMFLGNMGCTPRPTPETLLAELELLAADSPERSLASQALMLLEEISAVPDGQLPHHQRSRILVPDTHGVLRRIDEIYYDDMSRFDSSHFPAHGFPTHPQVSKSLAVTLNIRFLSSLELDEDEDDEEDDEDMREDLTTRISSVLNDYDIEYALNEFLANAADAGASRFCAVLDNRSFESKTIMSLDMAEFQQGPSLILYNDGIFSEKDFRGLRQIGRGGKTAESDTIGRFGLGALSLFHFTEVPMIVSGGYVMILDPSATHLPRRKGMKRTAFYRKLSGFASKYPDHMSPFESLFGFSISESEYKGTLFRLPLRTSSSLLSSKAILGSDCLNLLNEPYYQLARHALFFTGLAAISAEIRSPAGLQTPLWSVTAELKSSSPNQFDWQKLRLRTSSPSGLSSASDWLIAGSITPLTSVPKEHANVLDRHKFTSTQVGLTVRLALRLHHRHKGNTEKYHLFSSLRLPETTSLPLHLHAGFALASDRRCIRFDPPDSQGHRVPESAYNAWVLGNLVPPLYMSALHHIITSCAPSSAAASWDNFAWWPGKPDDAISREVADAFYKLLPNCTVPIFHTTAGALIIPSRAVLSSMDHHSVGFILSLLKTPTFVQLPGAIRLMVSSPALKTVDADFVKDAIQCQSHEFTKLFVDDKFRIHEIDSTVRFLLDNSVSPLGLPLLVLANRSLVKFSGREKPPVYRGHGDIFNIFPASRFINPEFGQRTIDSLISDVTLNIKKIDSAGVLELLQDKVEPGFRRKFSPSTARWIEEFWKCYSKLPGPLDPVVLGNLPLVPTYGDEHVSLKSCRENLAMPDPVSDPWLVPIITKLGIPIIKNIAATSIPLNNPFSLSALLKCLVSCGLALNLTLLSPHEQAKLATWIRDQSWTVLPHLDTALKGTLSHLPVWYAQKGRYARQLVSAVGLEMLPASASLSVVSKYLTTDIAVAEYSANLNHFLSKALNRKAMSLSVLFGHLRLPNILPHDELDDFRALLNIMLSLQTSMAAGFTAPNGNLRLCPIDQLYDHSVPLFASAFRGTEETAFIHHNLRNLQQRLRAVGLRHEVTFDAFLVCAQAFHNDTQASSDDDILQRAEVVYTHYNTVLPSRVMRNMSQWKSLEDLRFIPRSVNRRRQTPSDITGYCKPLPIVVSPGELVRQPFESVVWTQRGIFDQQPPEDLVAVNPLFGVPLAEEVVAHLAVMALEISRDNPNSPSLLNDLRTTYEWLSDHAEAARPILLCHTNDPIFLNVDDPTTQNWEWNSAHELVFNLHYDENGLVGVRGFLDTFKLLLLAAGAGNLSDPKYVSGQGTLVSDDVSRIRAVFNTMREEGQLTDIILMPTIFDGEVPVEGLRAHATFLAAAIPHIQAGLLSEMAESRSGIYPFEGSFFGAHAILEFIYTGDLRVDPPLTPEAAADVLRELLELLDSAEIWDMQPLKAKVEWLIAEKLRLVSPDTHRMIMECAERYHASSLVQFCVEFEEENRSLLSVLSNPVAK